MSLIGSHSSLVAKLRLLAFSSNAFGSRNSVTEPIFRCVSLAVNFETILFLSGLSAVAAADEDDEDRLRFVLRMFIRSRIRMLPCLLSDLYVPLIPVYDWRKKERRMT
jgi:hypothetical protein